MASYNGPGRGASYPPPPTGPRAQRPPSQAPPEVPTGPRAMQRATPPAGPRSSYPSAPSVAPPRPPSSAPPPPPGLPPPPPGRPPPPPLPPPAAPAVKLFNYIVTYDPLLDPSPVKSFSTVVKRYDGEGLPPGPVKDPRDPWATAGRAHSARRYLEKVELIEYQWDRNSIGPPPPNPPTGVFIYNLHDLTPASDLQRHFVQFGRIAELELKCDPRTGGSLGICFVRFVDDIPRNTESHLVERALASGRQDGHISAREAIRRTHGARIGAALIAGKPTPIISVEWDDDGAKTAAAAKVEVDKRAAAAPKPAPASAYVRPSVIRHAVPNPTGYRGAGATTPILQPPASTTPKASYTRKDDPNPPKLPPGPHLYNQGPAQAPRPAAPPAAPQPSAWGSAAVPTPASAMSFPTAPLGARPGMPAQPPVRAVYNGRTAANGMPGTYIGRQQPQQLQARPTLKKVVKEEDDMELESDDDDSGDSEAEEDRDRVFFPRTTSGPATLAMNVIPKGGNLSVRTPIPLLSARGGPGTQKGPLPPRAIAMRRLAQNGLPHVRISMASLIAATEVVREPMLRQHFKDFRPSECFTDGQNWYLTFAILDAARRAQLILGGKPFAGVTLTIYVEPAPTMEAALAAQTYVPEPVSSLTPYGQTSPYKLAYHGRAIGPAASRPAHLGPVTDAEIARDARHLIVRELIGVFERDLRTRVLETRVRELVDRRAASLNAKPTSAPKPPLPPSSHAAAPGAAEASGSGVKLPSFAKRQERGPRSYVKEEPSARVGKPVAIGRRVQGPASRSAQARRRSVSESWDRDSDETTSDVSDKPSKRKLSKAVAFDRDPGSRMDSVKPSATAREDAARRVVPGLATFSSSEDEDEGPVAPKARVKTKPPKPNREEEATATSSWLAGFDGDAALSAGRSAKYRATRMNLDYSDEEGQAPMPPEGVDDELTVESIAKARERVRERFHLDAAELERRFEIRDDVVPPDPFDEEMRVAEDDEDLHYVRLALERIRVGEPLHPYAEDAPDNAPELAHSTGSARSEGYYKIAPAAKSAYLPLRNRAQVDVSHVSATAVSRAARATTRRFVAGIEQQKNLMTSDTDVVKFNQLRTRKKQLKFARSPIHDWGLFAMEYIAAGDMICEYLGEVVRQQVADKRERMYERQGIGSSYLFRLDDEYVVDATKKGSISRLINHSCTPNSTARIITIAGSKKIVIYASQAIEPGQEVWYDYKFSSTEGEERIPCLCGSEGCRKYLN